MFQLRDHILLEIINVANILTWRGNRLLGEERDSFKPNALINLHGHKFFFKITGLSSKRFREIKSKVPSTLITHQQRWHRTVKTKRRNQIKLRLLMVPTRQEVLFWELENIIVINVNIDKLHSGDLKLKSVTLMVNSNFSLLFYSHEVIKRIYTRTCYFISCLYIDVSMKSFQEVCVIKFSCWHLAVKTTWISKRTQPRWSSYNSLPFLCWMIRFIKRWSLALF